MNINLSILYGPSIISLFIRIQVSVLRVCNVFSWILITKNEY
jgi:hypothetical protein